VDKLCELRHGYDSQSGLANNVEVLREELRFDAERRRPGLNGVIGEDKCLGHLRLA